MSKEKKTNRVSVVMEDSLRTRLKNLATYNERSLSDFVRLVLLSFVEDEEEKLRKEAEEE